MSEINEVVGNKFLKHMESMGYILEFGETVYRTAYGDFYKEEDAEKRASYCYKKIKELANLTGLGEDEANYLIEEFYRIRILYPFIGEQEVVEIFNTEPVKVLDLEGNIVSKYLDLENFLKDLIRYF